MDDKDKYQAELLANRLSKRHRILRKWARRERITCYRLYDNDIPEIPIALDLYEILPSDITTTQEAARFMQSERALESANDPTISTRTSLRQYVRMYLYERPYEKPIGEEMSWLAMMAGTISEVIGIDIGHVIVKIRRHEKGGSQYAAGADTYTFSESGSPEQVKPIAGIIQELGQLFKINLNSRIDTGIFFDHRPLRSIIRGTSAGKSVLNLFCYTGSFSVYAAQGKARRVESVDLSNTYLEITRENLILNGFSNEKKYPCTRMDTISFLHQKLSEKPLINESESDKVENRFDIIILDPPTFSNSKACSYTLDINKDWASLVNNCLNLLTSNGVLYFSTNSRRLTFENEKLVKLTAAGGKITCTDKTSESIPEDFKGMKPHRLWCLESHKDI